MLREKDLVRACKEPSSWGLLFGNLFYLCCRDWGSHGVQGSDFRVFPSGTRNRAGEGPWEAPHQSRLRGCLGQAPGDGARPLWGQAAPSGHWPLRCQTGLGVTDGSPDCCFKLHGRDSHGWGLAGTATPAMCLRKDTSTLKRLNVIKFDIVHAELD